MADKSWSLPSLLYDMLDLELLLTYDSRHLSYNSTREKKRRLIGYDTPLLFLNNFSRLVRFLTICMGLMAPQVVGHYPSERKEYNQGFSFLNYAVRHDEI